MCSVLAPTSTTHRCDGTRDSNTSRKTSSRPWVYNQARTYSLAPFPSARHCQTYTPLNLNLRSASRITVLAANFRARTFAELERRAKAVPWEEWLPDAARVRLRVTCRKSRLYHSDAVAERVAGAIGGRTKAHVDLGEDDESNVAKASSSVISCGRLQHPIHTWGHTCTAAIPPGV